MSAVGGPSGSDVGSYVIAIVVQGAPVIALRNHNRDNVDRSLCLTSGAGQAAAWQCGDLLVAHGLPGYMTKGRERSLTLVYNSATAAVRPLVAVSVDQTNKVAPTTVYAELKINAVVRASATWTGWGAAPLVRQLALSFTGDSFPTGFYAFTLEVRNQYAGGSYGVSVTDTLLIVNRRSSEFGQGWGLAGVEAITGQPGTRILWTGGDGSAKLYRNVAANTWAAAAGAYRDTLKLNPADSTYTRTLRHGIQVSFDKLGHHIRTVNRVRDTTFFKWVGTPAHLDTIIVPPGGTGTKYVLAYDTNGKLDRITDPAGRVLDDSVVAGLLTKIVDPDTALYFTTFAYDAANRMTSRTNRRGFATKFAYQNGLRFTLDSVRLDSFPATWSVTAFLPWDEKGLSMGTGQTGLTAVDTALGYTKIDGARTSVGDTAEFWVDRWGAPTKVRDPLGYVTSLKRGDAANPALVTRAQYPDGRVLGSGYNTRGNVTFIADSTYDGTGTTQTVTTSFLYGDNAAPDSPTKVRTPTDTTTLAYHDSLGLPDTITAQGGHKTVFAYSLTPLAVRGLISSVTELSVRVVDTTAWTKSNQNLVTSFSYDAFGDDTMVTSPKNGQTRYGFDAYRRVVRTTDPVNHVTLFGYDKLNHPVTVTVVDGDSLRSRYYYGRTDMLDSVLDPRNVRREWRYDAADEPIRLIDEVGDTAKQYYGPSGLVDSLRTRNGHVIQHRYDAAGQLLVTTYPAMLNDFSGTTHDFTVPGDSIRRTYDAVGRELTIVHAKDSVTRTFNREGSLRTEREVLRASTGTLRSDFTTRSWYDAGGRRTKFYNGTDTLRYSYGSDGLLSRLVVQWIPTTQLPDTFWFGWDGLGRRDSVLYVKPGALVTLGYDKDGNLRMVCSQHAANAGNGDYLEQRSRYVSLNADGNVLNHVRYVGGATASCGTVPTQSQTVESGTFQYDARHEMITGGGRVYTYDSSGNRLSTRDGPTGAFVDSLVYTAHSNRLWRSYLTPDSLKKTFYHDANGARHVEEPSCAFCNWRLYYYNSLGQMTGHKFYNGTSYIGGPTTCISDPVGRRVRACDDGSSWGAWAGFDGDNVTRLYASYPLWRFVHGPGTDDPLVALEFNGSSYTRHYYVTDGRGRHLAFTDALGANEGDQLAYTQNGGNQAGSIDKSNGFANTRAESPNAPELSFYRNRYYDQQTGRFTQEDPLDVAAGLNLYAYGANNPSTFTDPFGWILCFEGENWQEAVHELEVRTGTTIQVDPDTHCATGWQRISHDPKFAMAQWMLNQIIHDPTRTVTVKLVAGGRYRFNEADGVLIITGLNGRSYVPFGECKSPSYDAPAGFARYTHATEVETPEMAIHHEMRHAFDYVNRNLDPSEKGRKAAEVRGVVAEDWYAGHSGKGLRCYYNNPTP